MKISLKQYAELVTSLKDSLFGKVRVKLVLFYTCVFLSTIFFADTILTNYRSKLVEAVIQQTIAENEGFELDAAIVNARRQVLEDFRPYKYSFYILLGVVVSGVMYILASSSLRPINNMMESQKRFIANASHELRTPLSVMKTQSEVALRMKDNLSKYELETVLRNNIDQVGRISQIIDTLLRISNSLHSSRNIALSSMLVYPVVEKAVHSIRSFADSKKVALTTHISHDISIIGNHVAFEEIVTNLIQNAITYTPSGGSVTIESVRKGDMCIISIFDTGVGIPEEDLPHIFTPFFRGSKSETHSKIGSGLGLTLVKELVTVHKGSISVESELHKGTKVTLLFPLL